MDNAITSFTGKYRFLSNFYEVEVTLDRELYSSVEHAYQASKTLDLEYRRMIRNAISPVKAKSLGKVVPIRPAWEDIKVDIMRELIRQKFSQNYFKQKLLATGDQTLVEGNYWGDTFWGTDLQGNGLNWLGKILMEVRDEIKEV